ncbi:aldehyde dehydrogenase family protein [Aspergillus affinis]|uniref:aldehyde dehydrogenase family protein n=1 Tax=Aspergillus affinis TaxID=1070780 RepID=UPI0022FEA0D9|nr:aldehyde dehydrogenase [Aspergillus affinis]KAI9041852.1 aldehyde dehydrogenase [Aspergillus affinis]
MSTSQEFHTRLFINNEYVPAKSGTLFAVRNPYDDSLVSDSVHHAGQEDVDSAVSIALNAYNGPWGSMPGQERAKRMLALADLLDAQGAELATLESRAIGLPITMARGIAGFIGTIWRYYAGFCDKLPGEFVPEGDNRVYKIVRHDPFGVCAGIGAWNASLFFFSMKIAPAVAAGNTFIFKTSEKSPLGALQIGELIVKAGFPPGVINILNGDGKTGALLASHMDIGRLSFTGSVETGKKIQVAATQSNLKRVTLELGGKSPSIIFDDADLENALLHSSQSFLVHSGQICVAASRVLVHKSIVDSFVTGLKARFEALAGASGDPSQDSTFLGPVVDAGQKDRIVSLVKGTESGSPTVVLTGGEANKNFVTPTILLNPPVDSAAWREEIFGPVVCVRSFETEDEAISLANETTYGLSSCVFTQDIPRALRLAKRIQAGAVAINSNHQPDYDQPLGGWKQSGNGSYEGGRAAVLSYLQAKAVLINFPAAKL